MPLAEQPEESFVLSIVGGRHCLLPTALFLVVEEVYKRGPSARRTDRADSAGLSTIGLFRLPGEPLRIAELAREFSAPPLYGELLDLSLEPIHNLTGLLRRYVREMREPIFDQRLFRLLLNVTIDAPFGIDTVPAVRIVLRMLPRRSFSAIVYIASFLAQVPSSPKCHLDAKSLGIILGPGARSTLELV